MKKITLILFALLITCSSGYCASIDLIDSYKFIKNKTTKFINRKKQPEEPKEKMVQTKEEYNLKSVNVPLEERVISDYKEKESTKEFYYPKPHYVLEQYNYPQGSREVNIENIKKNLTAIPYFVADKEVKYAAYAKYYFSSDTNQVSSNFYVEKLDESRDKVDRILNFKENQKERIPIIESGTKETYANLHRGLSVVDWSADSKKILIKEKVGSAFGGIYKTYLYVYFMPTEIENGELIKLDILDKAIKYYFLNWEDIQIAKYRYDIEPIGFSAEDDDLIIVNCYVYDVEGKKVFLGNWGFHLGENQTILFSKTQQNQNASANGLIIKEVLN